MTHEPECPAEVREDWSVGAVCVCVQLRSAYQRGRENAAQAVLVHMHDMEGRVHVCCCPNVPRIAAGLPIAAARGDGECQHEWDHLKGEKCETCQRCGAARGDGEQA